MEVTIYATPTCSRCKMLKKKLEDMSVDFFYIEDEQHTTRVAQSAGIFTAPIVEIDGKCYDLKQAIKELGL